MDIATPQIKPMLEIAASRTLFDAPKTVREDLLRSKIRRPAHHIILESPYVLFVLTSTLRTRELQRRANIYGSPFPGLATALPNDSVCFRVVDGGRVHLQGLQAIGFDYCVGLGKDASVILDNLLYQPIYVSKPIKVHLAYGVSFGDRVRPANVHEYMEDLFIYHLNNYLQLRQSANDEKRRLSASR